MPTIKSQDGTAIVVHHWPVATPRAKVFILHGYGEHGQRYAELAAALNRAGFAVIADDHRGHGQSGGTRGFIRSFADYLDDFDAVLAEGERLHPGVPRFVIGHSVGGLITLRHAVDRRAAHAGVVLSSPFLRLRLAVPAWKTSAGKFFSRVYPKLGLPSGLSGAKVARDAEIARTYDADRLNLKNATARWFTETMAAQQLAFAQADRFALPLLLIHGEADIVADPVGSAEIFPRLGSSDKTLELLAGAYHEIFSEPPADRGKVFARVIAWLEAHTGAQPGVQASA